MVDRHGFTDSDALPEHRAQVYVPLQNPRYPIFVVTSWCEKTRCTPWRRFDLQTYEEARRVFEREVSVLASWQSIDIAELSGPGQKPLVLQSYMIASSWQ